MYRYFSEYDKPLSQSSVLNALNNGHVLLVSRCAFSSESELRQHYEPKGDDWQKWYLNRRHLYVICHDPENPNHYMTSSAEPDKTSDPWCLHFCSDEAPLTLLDINVACSLGSWESYRAAAVILPKEDYSCERIIEVIRSYRLNRDKRIYSVDKNHGYDCQTAARDVLHASNPTIDTKNLKLPPETDILAFHSIQTLNHNDDPLPAYCTKYYTQTA